MNNGPRVFLLVLVICGLFLSTALSAGVDRQDLLARAVLLREEHQEKQALQLFEEVLRGDPDNYQALLNAAFLHFRQGWLYSDKEQRKSHYEKLQAYAGRAAALQPREYQARLLRIVAKAKTAGYQQPGDQVRIARELRQELNDLVKDREEDPDRIYVLSWLHFKVGNTSPLEKFLASLLFGGLPGDLTTGTAIQLMEKAQRLRPDYTVYCYDLGLFHQRLGQLDTARPSYEKVLTMEGKTPEDAVYKKWARQRLLEIEKLRAANR